MIVGFDSTDILEFSGIGNYTKELVINLAGTFPDLKIHLFGSYGSKKVIEKLIGKRENIKIVECFPTNYHLGNIGREIAKRRKKVLMQRASTAVDIFHFTNPYRYFETKTYAVTIHDFFPLLPGNTDKFSNKFKRLYETVIPGANGIFVLSDYIYEETSKQTGFDPAKVRITPIGVDKAFTKHPPNISTLEKYGIVHKNSFFLYVGRIEERKNLNRMINAYTILPDEIKSEYKFVLVAGPNKNYAELLKNVNIPNSDKEKILLVNGLDSMELSDFYNSALCLVFATLAEGFGIPLLEAMNCGCPAITSDNSNLKELGKDTAILVDPLSVAQISNAMLEMAKNADIRYKYSVLGLERAGNFSWKDCAEKTYRAYRWLRPASCGEEVLGF